MPPIDASVRRVCLLRMSALGDLVQVWAAARAILRHHPDCELTWIIGKAGRQLFAAAEGIRFIEFDREGGLAAYRSLRRQLPAKPFDLLLMMQPTLRANLMTPFIRARVKLGYDRGRARELNWLFTNARLAPAPRQHHALNFFDFACATGVTPQAEDYRLPVTDAAREQAVQWLPDGGRGWVVLHPAASNSARNWRPDRYARLAEHAHAHGFHVALTGGGNPFEAGLCRAIAAHARVPVLDLAGRLDLQGLLAVLERARMVVAPDTGPAHMAAAQGTPVIGLYAASNPECTGPLQFLDCVVNRYPEALLQATGQTVASAPWGMRVQQGDPMGLISVADVTAMFDRVAAEKLTGR